MNRPDKVLVVDDDLPVLAIYEELLADLGVACETATSYSDAQQKLGTSEWTLVLIDQKLRGPDGPNDGLGLIGEVDRLSPGAKSIVVTGYADSASVEKAFADGAYDLIEKTETFETLVRVKVRNAMEEARQRWMASLSDPGRDAALLDTWNAAKTERDGPKKGRLLEDTLELLLTKVPGLHVQARTRSPDEEFDLVVRNESEDPFWSKESPYFLVECKNWSSKVGPTEYDRLLMKLRRRSDRSRLGFLVAVGGFTEGVRSHHATERAEAGLIVLVDRGDLDRLVIDPAPSELLKELHSRAVIERR